MSKKQNKNYGTLKKIWIKILMIQVFLIGVCMNTVKADEETGYGANYLPSEPLIIYENENYGNSYIGVYNDGNTAQVVTVTSSDSNVIKVQESYTVEANTEDIYMIKCTKVQYGSAFIEIKMGELSYQIPVFAVNDKEPCLKNITQAEYNMLKFEWEAVEGMAGYYIRRKAIGSEEYEVIAKITDGKCTSYNVCCTDWGVKYRYDIQGYMQTGNKRFEPFFYQVEDELLFEMEKNSVPILSATKEGDSSIKISWKKSDSAIGYEVYRSNSQGGEFVCVYKGNADSTEYVDPVKKGKSYCYKIRTIYPEVASDYSESITKMISEPKKAISKVLSIKKPHNVDEQYSGNWAESDDVYYYTKSGKLNIVCPEKNKIVIYTLNSKYKISRKKTVKLKYKKWGGFFAGPDGNFYIVVGNNNPKESSTKTVMKVIKYNSKWKKVKTAKIKGGAKNVFKGIYEPFMAGGCAMDMQGKTLYIHTCRTMFEHDDGLHHQSNISFEVNTENMTVKNVQNSYASHSFCQYARFDNGDLYLLDHGDAYPRALQVSIIENYDTDIDDYTQEYEVFKLKGETGDNYTGCTVGGMEISNKNVLACGASHPHEYTIKGVSGSKYGYAYNVYVVVMDKETKKTQVKWLTNYNPKKSNVIIEGTRMVKLDDNNYAIMYMEVKDYKYKLNYVVVDGYGNIVYKKKYANKVFKTGSQPILHDGRIVWMSYEYDEKTETYKNKIHAIPALTK